jgi:hypothetical protein
MSEKLLSHKPARKKTRNKKLIETTRVKIRTIYKEVQKIKAKLNQLIEKKTVAYIYQSRKSFYSVL